MLDGLLSYVTTGDLTVCDGVGCLDYRYLTKQIDNEGMINMLGEQKKDAERWWSRSGVVGAPFRLFNRQGPFHHKCNTLLFNITMP